MSITETDFGLLSGGEEARLFTLKNARGAYVQISNYGGIIPAIVVPDRQGKLENVTLGCADVGAYIPNNGYLGALIGRVGNRIARGRAVIAGKEYWLATNANGHHLHGGEAGFDKRLWAATPCPAHGRDRLELSYASPDGEEHYPGTLRVKVTFTWDEHCALSLRYEAVCDKDTLVNLTHHAYFNLAGQGSGAIFDHVIQIDADRYTEVDADCIPTGRLPRVDGTPFDLRAGLRMGNGLVQEEACEQLRFGAGYDHNFVLNHPGAMRRIARVCEPGCGRALEVHSDMNGVQFYTGNNLDGTMVSPSGRPHQRRAGFCLETQYYPDSVNHPSFPDTVLKAGDVYLHETRYAFHVE